MLLTFKHETLWAHQEPQRSANNAHLCATPLMAIVKKQLGLDQSLYQILQILSVTIFEKIPISQGFFNVADETENMELAKQLNLFEF